MNDLLETVVKGHMDIYKTALEEGRKIGFREGYAQAWLEIKPSIEAFEKTAEDMKK